MNAQWKPIAGKTEPGITRYQAGRAKATIHREENHLCAEATDGWLGLGKKVGISFRDDSLSDEVVLGRVDEMLHPPRFGGWQPVDDQKALGVTHYRGRENEGLIRSKVDAYITRAGDQAQVIAHVGHLGEEIQGSYFAPVPSDQEILKNL
ncbi:MAG: hypothetical protein KC910_12980 [Candidatus Eremiobacteraeota bacterium]|nr:hypothetical protein [Candidatus Eremiobacteraeota bacterium]